METLHYLLMKAHTETNRRILAEAAELGLSPGQPKILECLMQCGEINQKAIASRCEIEQATVGSILLRMERDGLICRTHRGDNRRSLFVSLTPRGRKLGTRLIGVFERADREIVRNLSAPEAEQLCTLLEKVCGIAEEETKTI